MAETMKLPKFVQWHLYAWWDDEGWVWENHAPTRAEAERECKRCFGVPWHVVRVEIPAKTVRPGAYE